MFMVASYARLSYKVGGGWGKGGNVLIVVGVLCWHMYVRIILYAHFCFP